MIYGPHNTRTGCRVVDGDSGMELRRCRWVDTSTGEIAQLPTPMQIDAAGEPVLVRSRFRRIVAEFDVGAAREVTPETGRLEPTLATGFRCYGRIRDEADQALAPVAVWSEGGRVRSVADPAAAVAPAPHRGETIVPAAARRSTGTIHSPRPFRFYGPFEISSALASCAGDEPRRDVVCPDCAMPSDGITPEDVTRSAVRKLAAAAVQHLVGHLAASVAGRSTAKPALPALTVTAGERYRTLIG